MIQTIAFIGSGNVATQLGKAFKAAGKQITTVYSPTLLHARNLAGSLDAVPVSEMIQTDWHSDLIVLAVPDRFVESVSQQLPNPPGIVVHTSGITPLDALQKHCRYGVFYPLQTCSKDRDIALSQVPFCIEASVDAVKEDLLELAKEISREVHLIYTDQRMQLHLAAVFVNNFVNYLFTVSSELLKKEGIGFSFLQPLIDETVNKIKEMDPKTAQTGPARRNDMPTLQRHLSLLKEFPQYRDIYKLLSDQIRKRYNHE